MERKSTKQLISTVCKALTLAMGVTVVALSALDTLEVQNAVSLLGIGLACAGVAMLQNSD